MIFSRTLNQVTALVIVSLFAIPILAEENSWMQISYPAELEHIVGSEVYPEYVLGMNSTQGWWFGGAAGGNTGGVQLVDAPQRPGQKAVEFFFQANQQSPQTLYWHRYLKPQLGSFDAKELVFDLYPVTDLTMDITVRPGTQVGSSQLPICWHSMGKHKRGRWTTVRLPVMSPRFVDKLQFDISNGAPGIENGKPVRFIIDNMRFEPTPSSISDIPMVAMNTTGSIRACYMDLPAGMSLCDKQTWPVHLEVSTASAETAELVIKAGEKILRKAPISLREMTNINLQVPDLVQELGIGEFPITVELYNSKHHRLAWTKQPVTLHTFSTNAMEDKRNALLTRQAALAEKVRILEAKGIGVEEPTVSLTVAEMFLTLYIPDDFNKQKQYAIAMKELSEVESLLAKAETTLAYIDSHPTQFPPLHDYDPTLPVEVRDGNFVQNGKPVALIGSLAWINTLDALKWCRGLGFNSTVAEIGLNTYYGGNQQGTQWLSAFLEQAKAAGVGVSILLASHNLPTLSAEDEIALGDGTARTVGLPWNLLQPATRRVFTQWYDRVLPELAAYPNLINVGLANEPTYDVAASSKAFAEGFRAWAKQEYKTIDQANRNWGSSYASFENIDLPSFFTLRTTSNAAQYDWERFLARQVGEFFAFLTQRVKAAIPGVSTSIKLCGDPGFPYLDEQEILFRGGQTIHGTDGGFPLFLDYLKSLDPSLPVFDGEWHMIFSKEMGNDPAYLARTMFQGVAHGIAAGYLWQWYRFEWASSTHGAIGSITRYPLGLDGMGCASVKIRRLMPILSRFAQLDGGGIRLLYSKVSHLHQVGGEKRVLPGVQQLVIVPAYMSTLEDLYKKLSRNPRGVRFAIPEILTPESFRDVKLLAAGEAGYIQTDVLAMLEAWVKDGGTLWLTAPGMQCDPWGKPHQNINADFLAALRTPGCGKYGKGKIVVYADWEGYKTFFDGPQPVDSAGQFCPDVECRITNVDETTYLYLLNTGKESRTFHLQDLPTDLSAGKDLWRNQETVDLKNEITLEPNEVRLVECGTK